MQVAECVDGFEGHTDVQELEHDRTFSLQTDLELL